MLRRNDLLSVVQEILDDVDKLAHYNVEMISPVQLAGGLLK